MPIIRPNDRICQLLLTIGLPEFKHNRRFLRSLVHRSIGVPPGEHETADQLAEKVIDLYKQGQLQLEDND